VIIHPELRALRGDDAPQRDAQTVLYKAVAGWKSTPEFEKVSAELDLLNAGTALAHCDALSAIFSQNSAAARDLCTTFVAQNAAALGSAPLGHVPLRHSTDGCTSTLLLGRSGRVTLSLVSLDGIEMARRPRPKNVSFGPNETWELFLAGTGVAELVSCKPNGPRSALLERREISIRAGTLLARDGQRESRLIRDLGTTLVSLRLQRRSAHNEPTREYDLLSGELVHQAAGNPRDSRIELMMAMLGRMRRSDAAPAMAGIALGEGSTALRWQALRECLALDTLEGFQALSRVAAATGDPLAAPAGALRAQLVKMHPQLQELARCPA